VDVGHRAAAILRSGWIADARELTTRGPTGPAQTIWLCKPQTNAHSSMLQLFLSQSHPRIRSSALNHASTGLETIVARALHRAPANESALLAWPLACGSAVADRTRALDFSNGILRIEVADAGWRRELANLAPRYVASINKYSAAVVKRIEFVVKA
jgi:hypothetical protein